ncbi:probable transporter Mch4p [Trichomonascus vanleenenianus]|uniref:putative transporter Mch4p n=1 Tax=Trichomonascus vanleenenianus TaxID=2268995 RepID=UPI003ECA5A94
MKRIDIDDEAEIQTVVETICPPEKAEEQSPVDENSTGRPFGEKDTEEFPEGGKGWLVITGTAFILSTTYGMVNAFGEYVVYYHETFPDAKSSVISLIGSLQPTVIYIASVPVVVFLNLLGVNYTLLLGSAIMVFGIMMISICKELWQFYLAQGVVFGFGAGIAFFTAMAIPAEWFKRRRAIAIGITAAGSSIGGIVWPIVFHHLVAKVGFPWANRIIGFIYIPLLVFASFVVQARLPRQKQRIWPNWAVLKDWRFVIIVVANAIGIFGLFPGIFYLSSFGKALHVRPSIQQYLTAILNGMSVLGRVIPPLIADKVGRLNVFIPCVFLTGILQIALWYPARSETMVLLFALLWGAASGSFIALMPSVIAQLFGIKDNHSRLAIVFLMGVPGCIAGSSLAGLFIPDEGDPVLGYANSALFSGSMMIVCSLLALALRLSYTRKLAVFI